MRHASIRARLLASFVVIAVLSASALSYFFLTELGDFSQRKLQERLVGEARLVAAFLGSARESTGGARPALDRDAARAVVATALKKVGTDVPSRLRVLDLQGASVADSAGDVTGERLGTRPEVLAALAGRTGVALRPTGGGRIGMAVAVPIVVDGKVIGASYATASTFSTASLLSDYRTRLLWAAALFAAFTLLVTESLARWLARPLLELERGVTAFAEGEHTARVRPSGSSETRAVGEAFNALAGEVETAIAKLRAEERRKSRFVSDVSHELRTPLTAIRGAAETLMDGDVEPEDERRFLTTIVNESDRLTRLANDLLVLQRIEGATGELPLRLIALGDVVRRAVEALEPLFEERGVGVTVEGDAPEILGDADRVQQVVGNLVDNASRVTPAGGTVRVHLRHEGRWATLSVTDGGPGITEADLPHVFERFYRSQPSRDRSSGGVGLGLSIVKAIVTAHAGEVEAGNAPDGGAVFTVRLPAVRP